MAGVCALAMSATAASALTTAYAADENGNPTSVNKIVLSIPVTAQVGTSCAFATNGAPNDSYDVSNILSGFTHNTGFVLQCTSPLRMAIVSANGGLLVSSVTPPAGYSNLAPYNVQLHIAGDSLTSADSPLCNAATLTTGGTCSYAGTASTTQGFHFAGTSNLVSGSYVQISAPTYTGSNVLVASSGYSDTLIVTLSASL